jgi:hypothetical protein
MQELLILQATGDANTSNTAAGVLLSREKNFLFYPNHPSYVKWLKRRRRNML